MSFGSSTPCFLEYDGVYTLYGSDAKPVDIIGEVAYANAAIDGVPYKQKLANFQNIQKDAYATSSREPKPAACKIGASLNLTECFSNSDSNVSRAVRERFIQKFLPCKMLPNDIKKIKKVVAQVIKTFFPEDEVKHFLLTHPLLCELKSPTMSLQRFERALDDVLDTINILPDFKVIIKQEIMQIGKKPRIVIDAGDYHQVSALLVVCCFEHFWFAQDAADHIKHMEKYLSNTQLSDHLSEVCSSTPTAIEGDGTSWDFTQSLMIRELIENPILQHIGQCLYHVQGFMDVSYKDAMASLDFRKLEWWNLKMSTDDFKYKGVRHRLKMRAVRPSGERGTSCLNHLVNCIMWATCLLDEPWTLFAATCRDSGISKKYVASRSLMSDVRYWATDDPDPAQPRWATEVLPHEEMLQRRADKRAHLRIGYKGSFEGDDSALATCKWIWARYEADIRAFWHRAGFNMKIIKQDDPDKRGTITFCGYEFLCVDGLPTKVFLPSIPRNIMNSAFTTSPYALNEMHAVPRPVRVAHVGAQSMYARAMAYAPHLPWLSNFFHAQAEYWQDFLTSKGYARVNAIDCVEYQQAKKFGVQLGSRVSIPETLEKAAGRYDKALEPLYDELVYRTTGHRILPKEKYDILCETVIDPFADNLARAIIPPKLVGA